MDLKAQWEQFCSMVRGWGAVPTSISPERASSVFGAIHENAVFVLRGDAAPSPAASEAITSSLSADTPPSLKKELVYAKLHRIHNSASCLIRAPMSHRSGMRRSPSIATDDSARSLIQSRTTMSSAAANDHHSATEEYSRSPSLRVVLPHPLIIHAEAPMALVGIHFTSRVQLTGPAPVFFVGCGFSEDRHRGSIREYISLGALLHPTAPLPPTISSAGVPQNDGAGSATTPRDAPLDHPLHLLPPTPSPRTSTPTTGEEEERVSQYTANWLQAGAALRSSRSSRSGDDDADINAAADDQMLQSSAQPMAGVGTAFSLATTTAGASVVPWVAMVGQRPASRSQPRIMNPALMSGGGATGGGATGAGGGGGGGGGASMAACSSAMSAIEVSGSAQCFLGQCDIFGGFSGTGLCCRDECVVCLQDCSLGGPSTTWAAIELHDAAQLSASYTTIAEAVGSGVVLSGMATALLHFSVLQRCGVVGVLATERSSITLTETDVEMSGSGINLAASAHASCHLEKCVLTARLPVGSVMGKPALDGTTAAHVGAEEEEDEQQDAAPPAPLPATTTSAEVEARLVDLLRTDLHIISHHYGGGGIPFCSQSIVVVDQAQVTLEECELACRIPTNTPAPSTDVSSLTTVATATPLPTAGTPGFTSASTSVDVLAWLPSDVESLAAGILTRHSITRQQVGDFIHRIRQPLVHESGGLMPRSQCGGSHNSTSSRLSQRVLPWLHPERVYSMEFSAYPSSNISDELLGTTSSKRILREEEEDGQLAMFGSLLSLGAHPAMLAAGGVCHVTARDAAHVRLQRCIIALHDYTMTTGPPMTVKMPFMNPAALNSPTSPLPVSAATPTNPATSAGEAVAPPPPPPPQTTTTATSDAPSVSAPPRSQPCVGVLADLTPFASCPLDLSRPTALRPSLLTTSSSSSPGQPPAVSPTSTTELSSDLSRPSLSTARLTVESERNVVIFEAPSNARRDDGPRSRQHHLGNNWAMVMICPTDLAGCEAAWPAGGPAEELAMRQLMAVGLEKEWVAVAVEVEEEEEETDRGPSPSSPNLPTTAPQLTTTLGPESTTSSSGTAVGESEVDPDLTPADGTSTNNNNNNTNNNNGRSTSGGKSAMASSSSSHRSSRPRPLDHIHIHGNIFLNPRHPATDLLEIHRERICTNLTTFARHNALHLEELYFIPTHTAAVSDNGTDGGEDDAEHHRTTANSTPERATTTTTTTTTTSMMDVGTSPKVAAIHLTLRSEMILGDVDAPPMAAERLLHSEGADSAQQQQQQQPDAVVVREAATLDLSDAEDGRQTPIAATVVVGGGGSPESTATPRRRTQPSSLLHSPSANTSAASSCQSEIVLSERFGGSPMAMAAGDGSTPAYVRSPAGAESVDRSGSLSFRNGGWQKKLATPLSPGDSPRTLQRSTSGLRPVFLLDEAMVADVGRPTFSTVVSPTSLPTTTTTTTTATTSASTAISSMVAMSEYSPPRSMGMMEEVGHLTPANTCSVAHYKEELIHAMHEVILGHPPPHPTHSATADDAADDDGSGVVAVDAASSRVDESHESPSPPRTCAGDPIRTQPPSQRPSVSVEELMRAGPRSPTTPNTLEAFTLHSSGKGSLETQRPEDVFCMMEPATDSRSEESGESPHLQRDEVLSEDVVVATAEEDEVVRGALESTVGPSSPVETEGADVSPPREVQVHEEEEDEDEDVVGNVAFTNPNHMMLSAYLLPEILGAEVAHLDNNSFCSTVRPESTDRRLSYRARMLSLSTDDSPDVPGSSTALHLHRDLHEARQAIEVLQSEIHELKQMLLPATPPHVAMAANASTTLNAADESGPIETPRTARGPTTVEVFNETASPRMVLAMQNQQQPMMLVEVEAPRGSTSHDVPASIQVPNTHDGSSSEGSPMMISRQATDAPPPPPQQQQQQDSWSRTRGTDSGGGEDELLTDTSASFFQGQPGDGGSASPLGAGATTSTAPFTPPPLSPTPKQRRAAARAKESAKRSTSTHHRLPAKVAATTERLASPAPRPKPATKDKKRGPATTSTTPSRPRPPPLTPPTHTTATTTTAPPQRTTTLPHPSRRDLLQSMADYSPPVAHGGSSFAHALQHLIRGTTSPGGCAAAALLRSRGGPATPITPRDGAHVDGQTASAQRWGSDLLAQLVKIHKQPMGSTQPSHQPKQVPLRGAMSAPRELWRSPYAPPPPTATSSSSSSNTTTAAAETTSIHRRAASASSPLSSHPVFGQRCDIDGNTTAPPHPYHDSRGEERKMEEPTATTTPSPASGPFHDPQNSSAEPHASSTAEHRRRLRPASALPPQTSKNDPHGPTSSSSSYASSPPAAAANTSEATTTSMRSCYISPWMQGENHHHDDDDAMQRRNEPLPVGPARLHVRYVQAQRARQAWDAFADAMEDDALEQRRLSPERQSGMIERLYAHPLREALQRAKRMEKNTPSSVVS